MKTFEEAVQLLDGGDAHDLDRNTTLRKEGESYIVYHEGHPIIKYSPNGVITLTSPQGLTTSVRNRFNKYTPLNISNDRGAWRVTTPMGLEGVYNSGITFNPETQVAEFKTSIRFLGQRQKERTLVMDYSAALVRQLQIGRMSPPPFRSPQMDDATLQALSIVTVKNGEKSLLLENLPNKDKTSMLYKLLRYTVFHPVIIARAVETANEEYRQPLARVVDGFWTPGSPHPKANVLDDRWDVMVREVRRYLCLHMELAR